MRVEIQKVQLIQRFARQHRIRVELAAAGIQRQLILALLQL